jgi:hypothetical protein
MTNSESVRVDRVKSLKTQYLPFPEIDAERHQAQH